MNRSPAAARLALLVALLPAGLATGADEPKVSTLVETLRFDLESPSAPLLLERLGRPTRDPERAWRSLATLAVELQGNEDGLDEQAARALLDGPEPGRLPHAAHAYDRADDPRLRAVLALGLARAYPDGAERLHAHLRSDAAGALDLLRLLAPRGLPREELEAARERESTAELARALLAGWSPADRVTDRLPDARETALLGLDPPKARAFLAAFGRAPDRPLLSALAEVLREPDERRRTGAHCLLLVASGRDIAPDPALWHAWVESQSAGYVAPDPVSEGAIAAAVCRAARALLQDLAADGKCLHAWSHPADSAVGATALALHALRAAGVPADHPVIQQALETTILVRDRTGRPGLRPFARRYETYTLSILAMALRSLGREGLEPLLPAIGARLAQGMLQNGQWTYLCRAATEGGAPASGDNSNTQYANLGLRAVRASGALVDAGLWARIDACWRDHQQSTGEWGYKVSGRDVRRSVLQMTASGIAGLAIAHEGREGAAATAAIREDEAIREGLAALGRHLLLSDLDRLIPYSLYAVERACVLTGTRAFSGGGRTLDWYREGAWRLLKTQQEDGTWGSASVRSWERQGFGQAVSTSFALLFLRRATATIGEGATAGTVAVPVTAEEVATPPASRAPPPRPTPDPVPWRTQSDPAASPVGVHLADGVLHTNTEHVVIRGVARGPWTRVEVGGEAVEPDGDGAFEAPRQVEASGPIEVVVVGTNGARAHATVHVRLDREPPSVRLVGPPQRAAAKQRLVLEADEPLDGVALGRHFWPAVGTQVTVTADLDERTRRLTVLAQDLAGNASRETFELEVVNRVLELDGRSAIQTGLRVKPRVFTAECWMRVEAPLPKVKGILGDTERAGFALFLGGSDGLRPLAYLHGARDYVIVTSDRPIRPRRWTHVAMTYDGAAVRLFVDGRLRGEGASDVYKASGYAFLVGATPARGNRPDEPLPGAIDEVRISDVVRYAEDFEPAWSHFPDRHTLLLYHFDTDAEEAVLDASGREHNGTPAGSPRIVETRR